MKTGYINERFDLKLTKPDKNLVSYSQFSQFSKCPLSWKLSYIDKLKGRESSIHTIFGDSMHSVVQEWLRVMYTVSIKASNELDLKAMLFAEMKENYLNAIRTMGTDFSTKEELTDFYIDGAETLLWLKRRRKHYFDPKNEILVGTEVPLTIKIDEIHFTAYLDLVLQDKVSKKILIRDLKTSGKGWNDWTKGDDTKTAQLILYKIFFAQQYNIPIDDIEVEYIILKRKVNAEAMFPEKRIQRFKPAQGKPSYNKVQRKFDEFIKSCFLPDGSFNTMYNYVARTGNNGHNCKFCEFRDKFDLCPIEGRRQL